MRIDQIAIPSRQKVVQAALAKAGTVAFESVRGSIGEHSQSKCEIIA